MYDEAACKDAFKKCKKTLKIAEQQQLKYLNRHTRHKLLRNTTPGVSKFVLEGKQSQQKTFSSYYPMEKKTKRAILKSDVFIFHPFDTYRLERIKLTLREQTQVSNISILMQPTWSSSLRDSSTPLNAKSNDPLEPSQGPLPVVGPRPGHSAVTSWSESSRSDQRATADLGPHRERALVS